MSSITEIIGTNGGRDERGLVSIVVPFVARSLTEVFQDVPAPEPGLRETGRTFTHAPGGVFEVDVTFEGHGGKEPSDAPTYSCKASFQEEALESHPQIEYLIKKFNGRMNPETMVVTFPATLKGSAGENALAGQDGIPGETKNPMAGVKGYMVPSIVWEKKYVSKNMPSFAMVGRVISKPPGGAPSVPNRSVWLVMPPDFTRRGTVYEITEAWQLLPEGTPPEVYNLGAPGDGGAGGLMSGASPANLSNAGDYFGGGL
jgi:hypothetical protein